MLSCLHYFIDPFGRRFAECCTSARSIGFWLASMDFRCASDRSDDYSLQSICVHNESPLLHESNVLGGVCALHCHLHCCVCVFVLLLAGKMQGCDWSSCIACSQLLLDWNGSQMAIYVDILDDVDSMGIVDCHCDCIEHDFQYCQTNQILISRSTRCA